MITNVGGVLVVALTTIVIYDNHYCFEISLSVGGVD